MFYWTVQHRLELLPMLGLEIDKFIQHFQRTAEVPNTQKDQSKIVELAKIKIRKLGEFYEKHYEDFRACLIPLYQGALRTSVVMRAAPSKISPKKQQSAQPSFDGEYRSERNPKEQRAKYSEDKDRESSFNSNRMQTTIITDKPFKKARGSSTSVAILQQKLNKTIDVVETTKQPTTTVLKKSPKLDDKRTSKGSTSTKLMTMKPSLISPSRIPQPPTILAPQSTKNMRPVTSAATISKPTPKRAPTKQQFIDRLLKRT